MCIKLLENHRWAEIENIVEKEFGSALPDADKANIIAATDENGKIEGFVIVEMLLRVGQIYSTNRHAPKKMINYVLNNIPTGASVIVIASEPRFERTARRFGMRKVEGTLFRRDF